MRGGAGRGEVVLENGFGEVFRGDVFGEPAALPKISDDLSKTSVGAGHQAEGLRGDSIPLTFIALPSTAISSVCRARGPGPSRPPARPPFRPPRPPASPPAPAPARPPARRPARRPARPLARRPTARPPAVVSVLTLGCARRAHKTAVLPSGGSRASCAVAGTVRRFSCRAYARAPWATGPARSSRVFIVGLVARPPARPPFSAPPLMMMLSIFKKNFQNVSKFSNFQSEVLGPRDLHSASARRKHSSAHSAASSKNTSRNTR